MATYTPAADFKASALVDLIHKLPHIGNAEFTASVEGDNLMDYWVMSVGVLAGAITALLLLCGIFMWIFTCCFCCKCCQRRCYCARCCCCKGSMGKIFYAMLLLLGVGSLYLGSSARVHGQDMLDNMFLAATDAKALLDVTQLKLDDYDKQLSEMLAQVNAEPAATKCAGLGLKAALQGVAEALATVELPIEMENMDLLLKYLAKSDTDAAFPPDFDKIMEGEGLLTFAFDGGLAAIALYVILLAFFACFANYRSKCSDHGCGRCIKCIYIFLVLVFGSIFLLVNIGLGAGMMGTAVGLADMCAAGPDQSFSGLFEEDAVLDMDSMEDLKDIPYWIHCAGTSPVADGLLAIEGSLNVLSNAPASSSAGGIWDMLKDSSDATARDCYIATPLIGDHFGTTPLSGGKPLNGGKACTTNGFDVAARQGTELCTSRQTIDDFNQLLGCPAEGSVKGWTDFQTDAVPPVKVPAGGLNAVYRTFVYDALCTDMVATFFYLWLALSASSFFILFAFCVLPCTSRNGGAKKGGDDAEADDTKA